MTISDLMPPHDSTFDSPWLKWGQAVVHTQALEVELETYARDAHSQPIATFRTEYHPKRHGIALITDEILVPFPPTWGLLLGDIANNYRSCLDQLAWALVTRGQTPPETLTGKEQRKIFFPIKKKRTEFKGELPTMLPGVRRADVAIVRRYQPYHRGSSRRHHSLVTLAEISNGDKHRTIQPVWDIPEFASVDITEARDCVVSERSSYAQKLPLKVDTEIVLIKVRKTGPNPEIDVEPDVTAQPALEQNIWLYEWLTRTKLLVFQILAEFSYPPEDLARIGIDWDRLDLDPALANHG
jgi:hypothetical protein